MNKKIVYFIAILIMQISCTKKTHTSNTVDQIILIIK